MRTLSLSSLILSLSFLGACEGFEYGKVPESDEITDADGDGVASDEDCNDADANVHPGASERCNGTDDDCSGSVDDLSAGEHWYKTDSDGDGYGAEDSEFATTFPGHSGGGTVLIASSSDEAETGLIEEPIGETGLPPADTDEVELSCPEGAVDNNLDCDDSVAAVNPGATEVCDGIDNNCDDVTDADAVDMGTWYADGDSDGYGAGTATTSCDAPEGSVVVDGDCNDADDSVSPAATEHCDGEDEDCDGDIDDSPSALPSDLETCYAPNTADESCTAYRQCKDDPDDVCLDFGMCMAYFGPAIDPSEGHAGVSK